MDAHRGDGGPGGVDFSLETAACKIFASELVNRAANDVMQIAERALENTDLAPATPTDL